MPPKDEMSTKTEPSISVNPETYEVSVSTENPVKITLDDGSQITLTNQEIGSWKVYEPYINTAYATTPVYATTAQNTRAYTMAPKRLDGQLSFSDLQAGDLFCIAGRRKPDGLFMKISAVLGLMENAICIESGKLKKVDPYTAVEAYFGEMKIALTDDSFWETELQDYKNKTEVLKW